VQATWPEGFPPEDSPLPTIGAKVAYDCLASVPIDAQNADDLIESLKPFLQWQSTLSYLKDPPKEYTQKIQKPVDIMAGLDDIQDKIRSGHFKGEYEVSHTSWCQSQRLID